MNPFVLAYREQQQLFLFDKTYQLGVLCKCGGLSVWLARFIVQFFYAPALALGLTLLLLAGGVLLLWISVRGERRPWALLPLCLAPALLMGAALMDNALHFEALTAWLMALGALALYARTRSRRLIKGCLLTVALYLAAGPAALLFALCAGLTDLMHRQPSGLVYLPLALLCGLGAWLCAEVPTLAAAWTPAFYYDLDATLPLRHWAPWLGVPVVMLLAALLENARAGWKGLLLAGLALAAGAFLLSREMSRKALADGSATEDEYVFYAVNGRWDDLIESCGRNVWAPRTANYLNMALAWKGELCGKLFSYDQRGAQSLVPVHSSRATDAAVAYVMFAMNNITAAQDVAFNTLVSLNGYCPAMLKMNAQIELMRGAYDVADKYLSLLEKAPHYREWALEQRRFLGDDAAVEADPLLGGGRRGIPAAGFALYGDPMTEFYHVVEANPAHRRAMEYALSFLLLMKQLPSLYAFVDRFWGEPALQELPECVQEALVFYSEYSRNVGGSDPVSLEWCLSHGVSERTCERLADFQRASLAAGGKAPASFRGTFWYYLVNTKI